jgi:cold shock CspA family protein
MRKAGLFLLILLVIGGIGYLIFPKSGDVKTSMEQIAMGKKDNVSVGQDVKYDDGSGATTSTEVSENLTLTVTSPADKSTVNSAAIQVIGKTAPNAEVFVNDQSGKADSTGNFFVNFSLDEGENVLTVVANDDKGNYAEKELTIYLESTE